MSDAKCDGKDDNKENMAVGTVNNNYPKNIQELTDYVSVFRFSNHLNNNSLI